MKKFICISREIEWIFATPEGRKKLQASAKFQRMAVITLHRDQVYESLDAVKLELSENVKSLAPIGLKEQVSIIQIKYQNILKVFNTVVFYIRYHFYHWVLMLVNVKL